MTTPVEHMFQMICYCDTALSVSNFIISLKFKCMIGVRGIKVASAVSCGKLDIGLLLKTSSESNKSSPFK